MERESHKEEKKVQNIRIDFLTNTIIVTKSFLEAASKVGTEEYLELNMARKENPKMRVTIKERRGAGRKCPTKGLTYDYMRKFLYVMDRNELPTMQGIIKHYEDMCFDNGAVYAKVKEWFLEKYPRHKEMIIETAPNNTVA